MEYGFIKWRIDHDIVMIVDGVYSERSTSDEGITDIRKPSLLAEECIKIDFAHPGL